MLFFILKKNTNKRMRYTCWILGPEASGKTTLFNKLLDIEEDPEIHNTTQKGELKFSNSNISFAIQDTETQDPYHNLYLSANNYSEYIHFFIIVVDSSRIDDCNYKAGYSKVFNYYLRLIKEYRKTHNTGRIKVILVFNILANDQQLITNQYSQTVDCIWKQKIVEAWVTLNLKDSSREHVISYIIEPFLNKNIY